MSFYVQNRSSRLKIDPPSQCQFSNFQAENFLHFQNVLDVSMRKEHQQPPWLINVSKISSKNVLWINTKSHKAWTSEDRRFRNAIGRAIGPSYCLQLKMANLLTIFGLGFFPT